MNATVVANPTYAVAPWLLTAITNFNYGLRYQALVIAYQNFRGIPLKQFYDFAILYRDTMNKKERKWLDAIGDKLMKETAQMYRSS